MTLASEDPNTDASTSSDTDDGARIHEPSTMEELLRIFWAASKRGENVSLNLVSRDSHIKANFKLNDAIETGKPAFKRNPSKKRLSPGQLRRNQSRMTAFIKKKEQMKKQEPTEFCPTFLVSNVGYSKWSSVLKKGSVEMVETS